MPSPTGAELLVTDAADPLYYRVAAAAGSDLRIEKNTEVTGDLHANGAVTIKKDVTVDGNVSAAGTVANQGTVSGAVTENTDPVALPPIPAEDDLRALADRIIEGDATFNDETVDDVVFVDGTVVIAGTLQGEGTILATADVRLREDTTPLAEETRISIITFGNIRIDKSRPFRGVLRAGGDVDIQMGVTLEGVAIADGEVHVKKDSRLTLLDLDQAPPVISLVDPEDGSALESSPAAIVAAWSDDFSGIDPATASILLDGVDRTTEAILDDEMLTLAITEPLANGVHTVEMSVSDHAGNEGQGSFGFEVLAAGFPKVVIEHPLEGSFTSQATVEVRGTVTGGGSIATVLVNDQPAAVDGQTFSITLQLEEGFNTILVLATDTFGNRGVAGVGLSLDTEPPQLVLSAPEPGQLVNGDSVRVSGEALDSTVIESVTVEGVPAPVVDNLFTADVELPQEGPKTITVVALDAAGNSAAVSRDVVRFSLPEVTVTTPADLATFSATTLSVAGEVSEDVVAVTVNGFSAHLTGTSFTADGIPLIEGGNTVTAAATNAAGRVATATIHVVRDLTPPRVRIHRPLDGSRIREATIAVSGLVNDIVPGTVNSSEAVVTINGIPAQVVNRSFLAEAVPLAPGENSVVAQAVDASGNVGEDRITVTLDDTPSPRLRVVSGNYQQGVIGTVLPEPLAVELLDADGLPVSGTPVIFQLKGNDGRLDGGKRQIAVISDAAGRAQVSFSLGTRAGAGNQVVEASAVGFAGPAAFFASALPGDPELVVVDSGGRQVGVAGQKVPRPLIAAVVDSGHNRLEGVPLRFQVEKGQGHFADGSLETVVATDSDGRAIVSYVLDSAEGIENNAVSASIVGLENAFSASFIASSRAAGDPAATSISGVVLDNTNVPVPGATLRIRHTGLTAVSDEEGQFLIEGAPVGSVQLIVDGSTVDRPGAWPDLEFDLVTIAGRDNTVNMPIFLLPLDLDNAIFVDETRGGTLTLPQIPGFALDVTPGSVTFQGGGKSGLVSVTVVHNDKVPMVPNFGQQPSLIVTIQPAGARFDPPARLTLPNVDGLAPGQVTEMYSFDHDLGHFVSIGPATVSDDATVVTSDLGVGIVKAGWHCGGDPETGICLHECPECEECIDPPCRCDPEKLCSDCEAEGSACDGEGKCKSGRQLIPKICGQLGQTEENEGFVDCRNVPELEGIPGLCGAALRVDYIEITHNCDGVDLKGALWDEELTSDFGCGGDRLLKTSTGMVRKGNLLAPPDRPDLVFRDYFWVCRNIAELGDDFVCEEKYTQKIFIDDCQILTKEIIFQVSYEIKDGVGECLGDAVRR